MPQFAVVLPAAGKSSRFGGKEKKPYVNIDGRAVWLRTAELFVTRPDVVQTFLVIDEEDREMFERRYRANVAFLNIKVIHGGAERFESVANALALLPDEAEFVAVHDAVRPCLTAEQIDKVFSAAASSGAAILAVPVADTLKQVDGGSRQVRGTVSRQGVWLAQTPQVFRREWLVGAYAKRGEVKGPLTDDSQLVEAAGYPVQVIEGSPSNIKITTGGDVPLAAAILKSLPKPEAKRSFHPFADEAKW